MARRQPGFTRASSLGPIAEVVGAEGASIVRVLQDVDLPCALLECPEMLVPLREQFRLLERAARMTGDAHFGARLGRDVKIKKLSAFGRWVSDAPNLREAIRRSELGLNAMLQTSTVLTLTQRGEVATWSIEFLDPECDGRYQNELLGLGYMIDVVRTFAGAGWSPNVMLTTAPRGAAKAPVEEIFRTNVATGHAVPTIAFDVALLDYQNRSLSVHGSEQSTPGTPEPPLPSEGDAISSIAAVIGLALEDGYPQLDWVASKLGLTRRSLQRRLAEHGTTYAAVVEERLRERSLHLIERTAMPITEIALRLGYSDAAHFTRAFRRWTGVAPSMRRKQTT
jgi:AraC-like DNA-binding protein